MTNAEIFHLATIRYGYGPRLAREKLAGTRVGNGYAQVEEYAQTLIASARQFMPHLPPIHFDFVLNGAVNAFTFKENCQYFIGLTSGAVVLLQVVLNRTLADSHLLTQIGDPSKEASDLPPLVGLVPDAEQMYQAGTLGLINPRTKERFDYAGHLYFQAMLFLIGHEIAHITYGHVDYLDSEAATPVLPEIGWNLDSPVGRIERQALEVQADSRSMTSLLESIRLAINSPDRKAPPWLNHPANFYEELFDCAFATNVLFRIFGDIRFAGTDLTSASYPPLPFRRAALMANALLHIMFAWGLEYKDNAGVAIRYAIAEAEQAIATITGTHPSTDGLQDASDSEARKHYEMLQRIWYEDMRDRLAPFAYEHDKQAPGFSTADTQPDAYPTN